MSETICRLRIANCGDDALQQKTADALVARVCIDSKIFEQVNIGCNVWHNNRKAKQVIVARQRRRTSVCLVQSNRLDTKIPRARVMENFRGRSRGIVWRILWRIASDV